MWCVYNVLHIARARTALISTCIICTFFFFFNDTATPEIYTFSLHAALPISLRPAGEHHPAPAGIGIVPVLGGSGGRRSEEHTSELQSLRHLVCRLLLEK